MRIQSANATIVSGPSTAPRRAAGGAFSIADGEPARGPAASSAPRAVTSLDALIALQAIDDVSERRRKGVRRGRATLDILDEIKVGLLAGTLDPAALARLKTAAAAASEASGDPQLDTIMAEIGLRAAVELAKFERR